MDRPNGERRMKTVPNIMQPPAGEARAWQFGFSNSARGHSEDNVSQIPGPTAALDVVRD